MSLTRFPPRYSKPWTPLSIAGCVLWLDPAWGTFVERTSPTTRAMTNGDAVGTWFDRSPSRYIAAAATDGGRASLVTGQSIPGGIGVDFADSDFLNIAGFVVSEPFTVVLNINASTLTGARDRFGLARGTGNAAVGSNSTTARTYVFDNPTFHDATVTGLTTGAWIQYVGTFVSDASRAIYRDVTNSGTDTGSLSGGASSSAQVNSSGGTANTLAGTFGHVLVYNRELTTSEMSLLTRFLNGSAT